MKSKIFLVFMILLLSGCKKTYEPVYYPSKDDFTVYLEGPLYYSAEDAREWIYEQNEARQDKEWDYEIGVNCKRDKYGFMVCEDTIR